MDFPEREGKRSITSMLFLGLFLGVWLGTDGGLAAAGGGVAGGAGTFFSHVLRPADCDGVGLAFR